MAVATRKSYIIAVARMSPRQLIPATAMLFLRGGTRAVNLLTKQVVLLATALAMSGCQSNPRPRQASAYIPQDDAPAFPGLAQPEPLSAVEAVVSPPLGWRAEPLKTSDRHNHQIWISPSGNTAYGVVRFKLPLPVGPDMVLRHGFLPEMRRTEGEARLLSSQRDPDLPGLRFVAEGGKYRLRTNLMTRGWKGWAVYAGTLRAHEVVPDELALAEVAREHTSVGLPRRSAETSSNDSQTRSQPGS